MDDPEYKLDELRSTKDHDILKNAFVDMILDNLDDETCDILYDRLDDEEDLQDTYLEAAQIAKGRHSLIKAALALPMDDDHPSVPAATDSIVARSVSGFSFSPRTVGIAAMCVLFVGTVGLWWFHQSVSSDKTVLVVAKLSDIEAGLIDADTNQSDEPPPTSQAFMLGENDVRKGSEADVKNAIKEAISRQVNFQNILKQFDFGDQHSRMNAQIKPTDIIRGVRPDRKRFALDLILDEKNSRTDERFREIDRRYFAQQAQFSPRIKAGGLLTDDTFEAVMNKSIADLVREEKLKEHGDFFYLRSQIMELVLAATDRRQDREGTDELAEQVLALGLLVIADTFAEEGSRQLFYETKLRFCGLYMLDPQCDLYNLYKRRFDERSGEWRKFTEKRLQGLNFMIQNLTHSDDSQDEKQ